MDYKVAFETLGKIIKNPSSVRELKTLDDDWSNFEHKIYDIGDETQFLKITWLKDSYGEREDMVSEIEIVTATKVVTVDYE